jgi:hypothetical protein
VECARGFARQRDQVGGTVSNDTMGSAVPAKVVPISVAATARRERPRAVTADEDDWRPVGVQHAVLAGGGWTLCGVAVRRWRIFAEVPFGGSGRPACPRCLAEAGRVRARLGA